MSDAKMILGAFWLKKILFGVAGEYRAVDLTLRNRPGPARAVAWIRRNARRGGR
ncbi:hypothetical protein IHE31_12150 [Mycetohabitans rhizoxinica]|uniref:hypothetical protein n=1 Tax=Mycetohabitans TaxID=2571159 RepID=UPI00031E6FFB|nr:MULTISPECIES: hypothetical protein [Mycetohabitans]MCG1047595.1 hypothetical protein [Mycetohabitans sp. B6]